ncbi:MAG: CDP-alcohol phosphatidyltransferase [Bacteroidetes bacterium]|nr:CDP-alcohol phosphatidyltransferase [Bacteroidota bacterium]MDF2450780.1 CDP-alcohol phosphatidyltransferase [Bacteroidota bacterium]
MQKLSYKIVNGISIYRIITAPVLAYLAFTRNLDVFKWMLCISFLTDVIDGYLARRFNATSVIGSKLDSIADDLTIVAAIIGVFVFKFQFIVEEIIPLGILLGLFIVQNILAFVRYKKMTSFHTYLAKIAAILQGSFFILLFFIIEPIYLLFYTAAIITGLNLIEEIIMILMLPKWEANVKGIYWILKRRKSK